MVGRQQQLLASSPAVTAIETVTARRNQSMGVERRSDLKRKSGEETLPCLPRKNAVVTKSKFLALLVSYSLHFEAPEGRHHMPLLPH